MVVVVSFSKHIQMKWINIFVKKNWLCNKICNYYHKLEGWLSLNRRCYRIKNSLRKCTFTYLTSNIKIPPINIINPAKGSMLLMELADSTTEFITFILIIHFIIIFHKVLVVFNDSKIVFNLIIKVDFNKLKILFFFYWNLQLFFFSLFN